MLVTLHDPQSHRAGRTVMMVLHHGQPWRMAVSAKVVTPTTKRRRKETSGSGGGDGRDERGLNRGYRYRESRGKPLRAVSEAYRGRAARAPKQGGLDPFNCRDNVGIRVKTHQTRPETTSSKSFLPPFGPPRESTADLTRVSDLAPF